MGRQPRSGDDIRREIDLLGAFIGIYCEKNHGQAEGVLCQGCDALLRYAQMRLEKCPYDPKPKCKDCRTHCYRPEERTKIREVMRFSGMHFVKRGRVDWLWKYFS
jgi:hypothetical protein